VPITNDQELQRAADRASALIQEIHDYCSSTRRTIADVPQARVRFPRGFIRTAGYQRTRFPFLSNAALKSNIAYTLMLSDTVLWLSVRTDIGGTARDMLNKLFIFLIGSIIESVTKDYLKGICGKNFEGRLTFLVTNSVIEEELKQEICWVWETRNRMHLFQLEGREYENDYHDANHHRTIAAFRALLASLCARGPYQ
jgi:hypothetical protein